MRVLYKYIGDRKMRKKIIFLEFNYDLFTFLEMLANMKKTIPV